MENEKMKEVMVYITFIVVDPGSLLTSAQGVGGKVTT